MSLHGTSCRNHAKVNGKGMSIGQEKLIFRFFDCICGIGIYNDTLSYDEMRNETFSKLTIGKTRKMTMPKANFFRMPTATAMNGAFIKSLRSTVNEASISNIISRPCIHMSYLSYLDDKADLYFYLLENVRQRQWRCSTSNQTLVAICLGDVRFFDKVMAALVHGRHAHCMRMFFGNVWSATKMAK